MVFGSPVDSVGSRVWEPGAGGREEGLEHMSKPGCLLSRFLISCVTKVWWRRGDSVPRLRGQVWEGAVSGNSRSR